VRACAGTPPPGTEVNGRAARVHDFLELRLASTRFASGAPPHVPSVALPAARAELGGGIAMFSVVSSKAWSISTARAFQSERRGSLGRGQDRRTGDRGFLRGGVAERRERSRASEEQGARDWLPLVPSCPLEPAARTRQESKQSLCHVELLPLSSSLLSRGFNCPRPNNAHEPDPINPPIETRCKRSGGECEPFGTGST
jgi:hypothetical protein